MTHLGKGPFAELINDLVAGEARMVRPVLPIVCIQIDYECVTAYGCALSHDHCAEPFCSVFVSTVVRSEQTEKSLPKPRLRKRIASICHKSSVHLSATCYERVMQDAMRKGPGPWKRNNPLVSNMLSGQYTELQKKWVTIFVLV
jgi:hypothetical protein